MYAKVFSQMFDGTLCTKGPWQALVTFQQLLVLADQDGNVDMTAVAISRRTTIPMEIITLGIQELSLPDNESRTPTEEGRRIVLLSEGRSWGWRIVNYKHYRDLKREEDRRAYHREYWHKRKEKINKQTPTQQTQPNQPIAEAKEEEEAITPPLPSVVAPPQHSGEVAVAGPTKRSTKKCPDTWVVTEQLVTWAKEKGMTVNRAHETEKFRDHTFTKAISDWDGAWRNWIRRAQEDADNRAARGGDGYETPKMKAERLRAAELSGGYAQRAAPPSAPRENRRADGTIIDMTAELIRIGKGQSNG